MTTAETNASLVRRLIVLDDICPHLKCPYGYNGVPCEGVPHMSASLTGLNTPPESSSGPGLTVQMSCEWGHEWLLRMIDHSGSIWITVVEIQP